MKYFLLILSMAVFSSQANSQTEASVFSWTDADGVVHFSDKKPGTDHMVDEPLQSTETAPQSDALPVETEKSADAPIAAITPSIAASIGITESDVAPLDEAASTQVIDIIPAVTPVKITPKQPTIITE